MYHAVGRLHVFSFSTCPSWFSTLSRTTRGSLLVLAHWKGLVWNGKRKFVVLVCQMSSEAFVLVVCVVLSRMQILHEDIDKGGYRAEKSWSNLKVAPLPVLSESSCFCTSASKLFLSSFHSRPQRSQNLSFEVHSFGGLLESEPPIVFASRSLEKLLRGRRDIHPKSDVLLNIVVVYTAWPQIPVQRLTVPAFPLTFDSNTLSSQTQIAFGSSTNCLVHHPTSIHRGSSIGFDNR